LKIPYFEPWITKEDKKAVSESLDQRWLTNGPILKKFEDKFAKTIKVKNSIGVGSATQALHLSAKMLDLKPNDEVIVPTFTFIATANAVKYCGAKPILVDVDFDTFNITAEKIEQNITKKTKAIIVVHYGGQSCDMGEILKIAKKYNLKIIEDCAHALGSKYKNKNCGSIGSLGCFSFYPTKIITSGEGGMITTNNTDIVKKIKILRSQGMSMQAIDREQNSQWRYDILETGYNYRLDEIRSSLGLSQLNRVDEINEKRIKIAKKYNSLIGKIKGIEIPIVKPNRNHIFHLYTIKIKKNYSFSRDELFQKLQKKGIGTSVQYYPLHLMTIFNKKDKKKFVNSNILKDEVLSLPIFPKMTLKQIQYVVKNLK
jgi:perosamine synthetase